MAAIPQNAIILPIEQNKIYKRKKKKKNEFHFGTVLSYEFPSLRKFLLY